MYNDDNNNNYDNHDKRTCVDVNIPVVIGEKTVQTLVQNVVTIECGSIKIDHVEASIKEIDFDILDGKVIFHGILHKQIFYVSKDNYVRHQAEDVQFSGFAEVPGAKPDMNVEITAVIRGPVRFELLSRGRLEQHVIIDVTIRVTKTKEFSIPLLGCITGTVASNGTAQPLAFVAVADDMWRLIDFTFTNNNGQFRFVSLPPGHYYVVAAVAGSYERKQATVKPCECVNLNFFQSPSTNCVAAGIPDCLCNLISGMLGQTML